MEGKEDSRKRKLAALKARREQSNLANAALAEKEDSNKRTSPPKEKERLPGPDEIYATSVFGSVGGAAEGDAGNANPLVVGWGMGDLPAPAKGDLPSPDPPRPLVSPGGGPSSPPQRFQQSPPLGSSGGGGRGQGALQPFPRGPVTQGRPAMNQGLGAYVGGPPPPPHGLPTNHGGSWQGMGGPPSLQQHGGRPPPRGFLQHPPPLPSPQQQQQMNHYLPGDPRGGHPPPPPQVFMPPQQPTVLQQHQQA
ncbi:unnamed protein product, partial [Ectocarpus sp. 12 AP-2014]